MPYYIRAKRKKEDIYMYSLLKLLENSYYTAEYDRDENGNIVFEIEVPGFNKDNLNVEITDGFLTVRGETEKRHISNNSH